MPLSLAFAFGLLSSQGGVCWKRSEFELEEFWGLQEGEIMRVGNGDEK